MQQWRQEDPSRPMTQTAVRMPRELHEWLKASARKHDMSQNARLLRMMSDEMRREEECGDS